MQEIDRKALQYLHKKELIGDMVDITGLESHTNSFQILERIIVEAMVGFGKEVCELQKQKIAKVMEDVTYQDRIGDFGYETVEKAVMTTKNVCEYEKYN
jgi:hypothetical protein